MNQQHTERLLKELFSGKSTLRERALLSVACEDRQGAREVVKVRQDFELLIQILYSDLGHASGEMRKNPSSQFWRREAIRILTATIDGIVFSLKKVTLAIAGMNKTMLSYDETEFLRERSLQDENKKVRLPPFRDNLKRLFKLFAKVQGMNCPTDFGGKGFDDLCQTYELRHRIMHPKSFLTYCVQDAERKRAGNAIDWLAQELQHLTKSQGRDMQ